MDGRIRSGQDVFKCWALGARGPMIGRAMGYGLGAMVEAGVTKAPQIIHNELDITMAFCGHTDIRNVDPAAGHGAGLTWVRAASPESADGRVGKAGACAARMCRVSTPHSKDDVHLRLC